MDIPPPRGMDFLHISNSAPIHVNKIFYFILNFSYEGYTSVSRIFQD